MSKIINLYVDLHFTSDTFRLIQHQTEVVVHESSDREDACCIDACTDDFQSNLVFSCNDNVFVFGLVAGWVAVGAELHVSGNRMMRNEAGERADLGEHSNLVDLLHDCIQDFTFEGSEDDGLVFHWIDDEALAGLDHSSSNVVDGRHSDDESILSRAGAFNFGVQLLSHCVEQLWAEISRMKKNLVLQSNLKQQHVNT